MNDNLKNLYDELAYYDDRIHVELFTFQKIKHHHVKELIKLKSQRKNLLKKLGKKEQGELFK